MKDDNQGTEKEIQDPLTSYLDAEARRRASVTNAPKSEDEVNDDYAIDGSSLSDEAVRLAISQHQIWLVVAGLRTARTF